MVTNLYTQTNDQTLPVSTASNHLSLVLKLKRLCAFRNGFRASVFGLVRPTRAICSLQFSDTHLDTLLHGCCETRCTTLHPLLAILRRYLLHQLSLRSRESERTNTHRLCNRDLLLHRCTQSKGISICVFKDCTVLF